MKLEFSNKKIKKAWLKIESPCLIKDSIRQRLKKIFALLIIIIIIVIVVVNYLLVVQYNEMIPRILRRIVLNQL